MTAAPYLWLAAAYILTLLYLLLTNQVEAAALLILSTPLAVAAAAGVSAIMARILVR